MQATKEINDSYLAGLDQYFRANISQAADKIERLKVFDVKRSVLEFVDLIKSYGTELSVHFRGYAELISFSSRYFYGGRLQAIKIREDLARPGDLVDRHGHRALLGPGVGPESLDGVVGLDHGEFGQPDHVGHGAQGFEMFIDAHGHASLGVSPYITSIARCPPRRKRRPDGWRAFRLAIKTGYERVYPER